MRKLKGVVKILNKKKRFLLETPFVTCLVTLICKENQYVNTRPPSALNRVLVRPDTLI